jgi:hypothetical protein
MGQVAVEFLGATCFALFATRTGLDFLSSGILHAEADAEIKATAKAAALKCGATWGKCRDEALAFSASKPAALHLNLKDMPATNGIKGGSCTVDLRKVQFCFSRAGKVTIGFTAFPYKEHRQTNLRFGESGKAP